MSRRVFDLLANIFISGLLGYATILAGAPVWVGIALFGLLFVLWSIFDAVRDGGAE